MSLQLILGGSGSGKSQYLYNSVIESSMVNPDENYIVIVPEQYTMETQKRLVLMHPRKGILNIDVVSFQRLAFKVFEELGGEGCERPKQHHALAIDKARIDMRHRHRRRTH